MRTERGDIDAEVVVIAGGMFSAELGRLAGVRIPVVPMSHEYIVTQPFRERDPENPLPTLRDPDLLIYFREEGGGLVMGGYERPAAPAFMPRDGAGFDRIPPDFNGRLLEDDWDRFEEIVVNSRRRVPQMEDVKVTRMINGPEGFTPDNEFCLGETEVRGLFVAGGFCAHGLAGAGGVGKVMAEWIAAGEPSMDLWQMDVRRFGAQYRSPSYTLKRVLETYETYYDIHYPFEERQAGPAAAHLAGVRLAPRARRGLRREVRLGARELVRVERGARRRVAAPARLGGQALVARDRRRARGLPGGRGDLRRVVVREARGRGAGRGRRCSSGCATTASPARSGGSPTRRCSTRAAGSSATSPSRRLAEERFSIVTGTAFGNHDREWIRRHLPDDGSVQVHDVTSAWACFGIWGPARARRARAAHARSRSRTRTSRT